MSTKTCNKCGWVFPATQKGNYCPICHEPFEAVVCRKCGRVVSGKDRVPQRLLCKVCHNAEERVHMVKYYEHTRSARNDKFDAWLSRMARVPKDYPTLTENQWMQACRYFGGCARCGSSDLDTRGFFISFKLGGRYCDWNVIPLCPACARAWQEDLNPFNVALSRDKNRADKSTGLYRHRDCLDNIVKYLDPLLSKATGDNCNE